MTRFALTSQFTFDKPINFDVQPGQKTVTNFGVPGFELPGFPINLATKSTKAGTFAASIDAYCLNCGLIGSAEIVGRLVIDVLNPSKTDFVADLNLNAMLALEVSSPYQQICLTDLYHSSDWNLWGRLVTTQHSHWEL